MVGFNGKVRLEHRFEGCEGVSHALVQGGEYCRLEGTSKAKALMWEHVCNVLGTWRRPGWLGWVSEVLQVLRKVMA